MSQERFSLSAFFFGLLGFMILIMLGFLAMLLMNATLRIENLYLTVRGLLIVLFPFLIIFWVMYRATLTEFKADEIVQYNFLGKTKIAWKDVVNLHVGIIKIKIESNDGKKVIVSLAMYKDPHAVIQFINVKTRDSRNNV
jgi:hypothetical protein